MKSFYQHIDELPISQWQYYFGIDDNFDATKPFVDNLDYSNFILSYFRQGGKVRIFELCNIEPNKLRLPNHICSVFFLGILLYSKTKFSRIYKLEGNTAGDATFPFIWFLIALFHDNAYQLEDENQLQDISTIPELMNKFNITHSLLDQNFLKCKQLLSSRSNYFKFRKKYSHVVDHGILGGMLLFDRLNKIRSEKQKAKEDSLFWGVKLKNQYKTAADAISIHNIWLQPKAICEQYNIEELEQTNFKPIRFKDFPLFYILGIIDTIEPLKTYKDESVSDLDILKSIDFEFGENFLSVGKSNNSQIDFNKLIGKTEYLKGWLDIDININATKTKFELMFK